jgi:mRNA-degrading endonuclease RelE of RelBE toxin-antitoxin system
MSYKLEFHNAIAQEYNEAYEWYEERSEGLGERFIASVRQTMEKIGEHPLLFGKRSKKGFREARIKGFPYLIIYKIYARKKIIFINTIHHTSRHPRRKYRK